MADPCSLFIGQLCPSAIEKDLEDCFDKYGHVVKATVVRDRETGESKCFGFVQFETSTEANDAINGTHGAEIKGSAITVEMSREKRQFRGGFEQRRGSMRNSEDSYRGRGGYSRGGYGRPPREFNSERMGSRSEGYDTRGRGSSRGPPRFANNRHNDEDRYGGGERRGGNRYERQEERYEPQESSYSDRYSSERRPERRPKTEWHEEEYEEPRERRSSFGSRGGGGNTRGGYNARGRSSRGDYGGRSEHSQGGGYSGGSDRGGFSRRGSDRGSYSGGGGGDRYASRSERPPREDNRDWYGASERRSSVSESRPTSSDRYSRNREDDGGFRGRGRGRPRGAGRGGRGSYSGGSGRGSYGGSNRSFGEDY